MIAAVLCCAQSAFAQEPCRLDHTVAPDYGGVMLGMRLEEIARMFPGAQDLQPGPGAAVNANAAVNTAVNANAKPFVVSLGMLELGVRKEAFKGVDELMLSFLDGAVRRIDVRFRRPEPWNDIAEFTEHASKRLAVPADSWDAPALGAAKQSRVLNCRGFAVVVRIDKGGPSILSIVDTAGGKVDGEGDTPHSDPAPTPSPAKRRRT